MFKYFITKEEFNKLKDDKKFLNAIKLLRMDSAIITLQTLMLRTFHDNRNNDSSRDKRDRMEIVLYYGAVLYESLRTIYKMRKWLMNQNECKNCIKDIDDLLLELDGEDSFTNKVLKRIRDKLTFHFDNDVFSKAFDTLAKDFSEEKLLIVEGDSERSIDINYPVIPVLYFNYLISLVKGNRSEEEKFKYIFSQMNLITGKLREVIGNIAGELLKDKLHTRDSK